MFTIKCNKQKVRFSLMTSRPLSSSLRRQQPGRF